MSKWRLDCTRRRPYGRRSSSLPWVEDREYWPKRSAPYWWLDPASRRVDLRTKAIPMPHGGVRHVFRCPLCKSWRAHLYNIAPCVFLCRRCLGLRYKSQYIGRRLDASRERIKEARLLCELAEAMIKQKKEADRRARRAASARLRRQQAIWRGRRQRLKWAELQYEQREYLREGRELRRVAALIGLSA